MEFISRRRCCTAEDRDLTRFPISAPVWGLRANNRPLPSRAPMDRSGAPKIRAFLPRILAIAALEAIPKLDGLSPNFESSGGSAAAGYCHCSVPVAALSAYRRPLLLPM